VLHVKASARPPPQRLLGLSSSALGVVCGQPRHGPGPQLQQGFEIGIAARHCFGRPLGNSSSCAHRFSTTRAPTRCGSPSSAPSRSSSGALLEPSPESELVAWAAVRLAWQGVDDIGEPDERTSAVLDALARELAAFAARDVGEGAPWSAS
jgi:hypothetical protein